VSFKFKGRGLDQMIRNAERVSQNVRHQLEEAAQAAGDDLVEKVRDRTPVKTGILRDSFTATKEVKRNKVVIHVATDVPYAPFVHEDLKAQHQVGDAKFLESVMDEAEPQIMRAVGARINLKKAVR
jgi:HK97 gp10 family phage protein